MVRIGRLQFFPNTLHFVLLFIVLGTICYVLLVNTYFSKVPVKNNMLSQEGLRIKGKNFTFLRKPFLIMSGSLHYFRVPVTEWEDRLIKMKAMGLNTVDIYIPWNLHEPIPGKFNFEGNLNLRSFLSLVETYHLLAVVRPGPYICSEWDLGGLPSWLLRDKNMKLRSSYKPFMTAVEHYFNELLPLLSPLQFSSGGPIIAFQIENEYGVYGDDVSYLKGLKQLFEYHQLQELFFVCDNEDGLGKYKLDGVLQTVNFMVKNADRVLRKLEEFQPGMPMFVTEFWDGWFDHWGEKHHTVDEKELTKTLKDILNRGASFNLYMWHGGTNFGFMNGANANDDGSNYQCDVTSYDYNAPVSETGDVRSKYHALKNVIMNHAPPSLIAKDLPWFPEDKGYTSYGDIEFTKYIPLETLLSSTILHGTLHENVVPMEMLPINENSGQSYGYIVYQTEIRKSGRILDITNARDFAVVILNGNVLFTSSHKIKDSIPIDVDGHLKENTMNRLIILVENCGRVNYGKDLNNQRKGILGGVTLDGKEVTNWKIYPLEFQYDWVHKILTNALIWKNITKDSNEKGGPCIFFGHMFVHSFPRDTILEMPGWFKGVVFVNGRNLGRYWNIGPQKTLYVPNRLLTMKDNPVVLFDLRGKMTKEFSTPKITSTFEHDLGKDDSEPFLI